MSLSAKEAAELVGMSKAGILKAIKTGKVSAQKDLNEEWRIEPAELFRVYTAVSTNVHTPVVSSPQVETLAVHTESTPSLQAELAQLKERLADKDDVIADLRARLDAEAEERRKLTHILTELRTPQKPVEPTPTPQPRSWWQRLLGGKG